MRPVSFHLERKVAIKPKPVFKICCHIQVLSSPRCSGYYIYSFRSDKGNQSPLKPKHSLTSGSAKWYYRNSYFCDSESQASTVTLQNCCAHKIHSRHFLLHVLFHILNSIFGSCKLKKKSTCPCINCPRNIAEDRLGEAASLLHCPSLWKRG